MIAESKKVDVTIKPPLIFLISIMAGIILQIIWPISSLFFPYLQLLGLMAITTAVVLMFWAQREFDRAQTAVNHDFAPTSLVTTGPYQHSRNPMYIALALIQIGLSLGLGTIWLGVTLLPALVIIGQKVVKPEESYMVAHFGESYLAYKASVRRWL